jgi:hypothetical protein
MSMAPTAVEFFRPVLIAIVALLAASVALAQETPPDQVLDQVDAFNANVVLEMAFDDPNRTADYSELLDAGDKTFAACKLGVNGLYCLETDGAGEQVVRYWKEPQSLPNVSTALVNCSDATLGLDGPQPCVGMTVDSFGAIWLAGKPGPSTA